MSENEKIDTRGTASAWTDRELLAYIFSAIEHSKVSVNFFTAPAPVGRNKSACSVKIMKLKKEPKVDMDLLTQGLTMTCATPGSHVTKAPCKHKAEDGEGEQVKKCGRAKKAVEPEPTVKQEVTPESEGMSGAEEVEEEV